VFLTFKIINKEKNMMKQYNYDIYDSAGKIGLDVQIGWEGVGCRVT
jgi:hypothetical protein